jgi:rhodanese-related sulfurtransferase
MNIKSSQDLVNEANQVIETLDQSIVKLMMDNNECTLIDVRDIRELWKEGTVKDSKHIPRGMLEFWLDSESSYYKENKFDPNKKIILFCALGMRSALATKSLVEMGFKNVAHVKGGFDALRQGDHKIITKKKKIIILKTLLKQTLVYLAPKTLYC